MSNKNSKSASSKAEKNQNQVCSARGCFRTLQGWTPKQRLETSKGLQQESAKKEQGEADE